MIQCFDRFVPVNWSQILAVHSGSRLRDLVNQDLSYVRLIEMQNLRAGTAGALQLSGSNTTDQLDYLTSITISVIRAYNDLLTARSLGVIVSLVRRFSFKWANMHRWTDESGGVFF